LKADSYEGAAAVKVTNIVAADKDGNSTDLSGADKDFAVNHPKGDVNDNFETDIFDLQIVINHINANEYDAKSDMYKDNVIDIFDVQEVINAIVK
jgi:hypothetical protein